MTAAVMMPATPAGQTLEVDHQVGEVEAAIYRRFGGFRPVRTLCGDWVWPVASSASLPPCSDCAGVGR